MATVTAAGVRQPRARARYTRVATFGLAVCAIAAASFLVVEGLEAIAFIGPFVAIPTVAAALVWRFGTWAKVLGAAVGLLLLSQVAPALGQVIVHPNSFFDFVPFSMFTIGALVAVAGSVAAIVKRAERASEATVAERRIQAGATALLVALVAFSGIATTTGRTTVDEAAAAGAHPVEFAEFAFEPGALQVTGDRASFVVRNSDRVIHTFTVDALGIDRVVTPGSEVLVELSGLDAGTYYVYCKPHANPEDGWQEGEDMFATLVVE